MRKIGLAAGVIALTAGVVFGAPRRRRPPR
ncbi:hypothetical protein EV193_104324 [Herbihabitans rhizosphaerae]|uniref:Uncharacterized protein n=1 Tax=Herbihabitans rhizosphaerae TaxID=1872711 RepID=A0A4Q7KTG7_9PSEU|nr:hypothetical protein EV193_104324 [Herbihabitans rhizosphaerae]